MKNPAKCWELFECSEKNCPAYKMKTLRCWLIPETHCRNEIQGKFLEKIEMCLDCEVFHANIDAKAMAETLRAVNVQFKEFARMVEERDRDLEEISMELALGLSEVFRALNQIASGDPSVRIPTESKLELMTKLKQAVNQTAEDLGEIVDLSHEFAIGLAEHFDTLHRVSEGDLQAKVCGTSQVDLLESLKHLTNKTIKSVAREIANREQAEAALRESENVLRMVINATREAMIAIGEDGLITLFNPAAEKMFGRKREEMIGQTLESLMPEGFRQPHQEYVKNYFATGTPNKAIREILELPAVRSDGSFFPIEISLSAGRHGDAQFVIAVARDITERRQAEAETKRVEAQLQQAQQLESIGTLAGGIAHDFNNLLMAIQGSVSIMLLDMDDKHPYVKRLHNIENQIQRGARLTGHLLGYARRGRYEVKRVNLNQLVEEISETFCRTRRGIKVHRKLDENLLPVKADTPQIEQVLMNLFLNAADAMPGGGDLILNTTNVTREDMLGKLYLPNESHYVRLTVTDTGTGMDKETMERIFDPFFTTKEMGRGMGLGLASVYGIVKGHGGYIDVNSKKGLGTTFCIYLPISREVIQKNKQVRDKSIHGTETVLLVDDEDPVRIVTKELLESLGYGVIMAGDGKEAVEIYRKRWKNIDIVVLDMVMPNMGGGEAYDRMKEINPDIKVLLSSGYSIESEAADVLQRGCNGFVQKPFRIKELSGEIREILDSHSHP